MSYYKLQLNICNTIPEKKKMSWSEAEQNPKKGKGFCSVCIYWGHLITIYLEPTSTKLHAGRIEMIKNISYQYNHHPLRKQMNNKFLDFTNTMFEVSRKIKR